MGRTRKDLSGQVFGRLTALEPRAGYKWLCRCSCGNETEVRADRLQDRRTQSCGCLQKEVVSRSASRTFTTHGRSEKKSNPEYQAWSNMKSRCLSPDSPSFWNYGGRGITVCKRWMRFENFFADMGPRPDLTMSLERINNNGNYEPRNCKWATRSEQLANRRARKLDYEDRSEYPILDLCYPNEINELWDSNS